MAQSSESSSQERPWSHKSDLQAPGAKSPAGPNSSRLPAGYMYQACGSKCVWRVYFTTYLQACLRTSTPSLIHTTPPKKTEGLGWLLGPCSWPLGPWVPGPLPGRSRTKTPSEARSWAPSSSPAAPGTQNFGAHHLGIWEHFGTILGAFWDHFGSILGAFWDHFGSILGPFWEQTTELCTGLLSVW